MEAPVEIRYAGVVVARASEVRRMTVGGVDLFLSMPEPLPAGTVISLGGSGQARIEKVIESADPSVAGVYVKLLAEGEASLPWTPAFREDEVPAPRPPAVVVSPMVIRPVHIPRTLTPREVVVAAPPPEPVRAEPVYVVPPAREPMVETPLPEVVASVVEEPVPVPAPFVAAMPQPNEQVAVFDSTPEPPPAVVERALKRDRKRSTIVVAVAPPAEPLEVHADDERRPAGVVEARAGEIDTGSRKIRNAAAEVQSASIMVEVEPQYEQPPEPAAEAPIDGPKQSELRLEDLSTARPLPAARGRATKRRRTTQR